MPVINVVVDLSEEEAQGQREKIRRPECGGPKFLAHRSCQIQQGVSQYESAFLSLREFSGRLLLGVSPGHADKSLLESRLPLICAVVENGKQMPGNFEELYALRGHYRIRHQGPGAWSLSAVRN